VVRHIRRDAGTPERVGDVAAQWTWPDHKLAATMVPDMSRRRHVDRDVDRRRDDGSSQHGLQALGIVHPILQAEDRSVRL
jgi:hypothetical protein